MNTCIPACFLPSIANYSEMISEEMKASILHCILQQIDKSGLYLDADGYVDVLASNASLQLLNMMGKLKNRHIEKSSKILKLTIKQRLEAEGVRGYEKRQPIFSLQEFLAFTQSVRLLEELSGRDLMVEFGYDRKKLTSQYLNLFRKSDGFFADSDLYGESSLFKTGLAVFITESMGMTIADIDRKLPAKLITYLKGRQNAYGGFYDCDSNRLCSIAQTAAAIGIYQRLIQQADSKDHLPISEIKEAFRKAEEFINRLRSDIGGYKADGLSPSPDLVSTAMGVLAFGLLHDNQYHKIPNRKAVLQYVTHLERRDGGYASSQWKETSDIISTHLAVTLIAILS